MCWSSLYASHQLGCGALQSPKIPLPPPHNPEWKLHDGVPYDLALHNLTVAMLTRMNEAIDLLPVLEEQSSMT